MAGSTDMLGRYTLEGGLGEGSMGRVYRAQDSVLHREVALKVIDPGEDHDASALLGQFVREARTAAQLDHPHIVRIYDITRSAGRVAVAMELCPGGSIADRIQSRGPLPWREACELVADAAEGLAYAHEQGVIHRDIKPANLLFDANGRCKLADFGLAHKHNKAEVRLLRGKVIGTPYYIAPEQIRKHKPTPATDLYSLGVTLWAALTGSPVFEAKTPRELYKLHLKADVPDLRDLVEDVPTELAELLRSLLAKDPRDRPADAAAVAQALRDIAAARPYERPRPPKRRESRAGLIGSSAALLILAALGGAAWWSSRETPPAKPAPVAVTPPPPVTKVEPDLVTTQAPPNERTRRLLIGGQLTEALLAEGNWTQRAQMLEGEGVDTVLRVRKPIRGDAIVRLRLALGDIKGTVAAVRFDEDSVFCFDGRGRVFYVKGPIFDTRRNLKLGDTEALIQPNIPFHVELVRQSGELILRINDEELHRTPDPRPGMGTISLHPHRNTMRVYAWEVEEVK